MGLEAAAPSSAPRYRRGPERTVERRRGGRAVPLWAEPVADPDTGSGRPAAAALGKRGLCGVELGRLLFCRPPPPCLVLRAARRFSELGSSDPLLGGGSRRYPTDEAAAAEDSHRGIAVQKVTGGSAAFRTSSSAPPFLLRFAGLRVSAAARPRASSVPRPLCGPALRPERGAG